MIKPLSLLLFLFVTLLMSFKIADKDTLEFGYPKNDQTAISMQGEGFKEFKKEWRGKDYYYMSDNKNGIICSVLYYKLNKEEVKMFYEPFGIISPALPSTYFTQYSNLKQFEKNNEAWGGMDDEFMFRQNDITEMGGVKIPQKHMYGYAMFGKDLFVNIHLSKVNCSPADSTEMRAMLQSMVKKVK